MDDVFRGCFAQRASWLRRIAGWTTASVQDSRYAPTAVDRQRTFRGMAVRKDCRHYSTRSISDGEVVQRCRLGAAEETPFSCPDDCLFFEARPLDGGWSVGIAGT